MIKFDRAYFQGVTASNADTQDNPFPDGSMESRAWRKGRESADKVDAYVKGRSARQAGHSIKSKPKHYSKEWLKGYHHSMRPEVFCVCLQRSAKGEEEVS